MRNQPLFRVPKRITITIPYSTYQLLLERSGEEGRSLSNLAAYLLEHQLQGPNGHEKSAGAKPPR
ncbi:MAG: hypothetical protein VKN13_01980 [Cyanobacteriota bacterium]|nr:hypothetical protein [Cyanobacteriota bacterium]